MKVTYLGHSGFLLETDTVNNKNPLCPKYVIRLLYRRFAGDIGG